MQERISKLGRYDLLEEHRRDDCGTLYVARDPLSGRRVSICKVSAALTRYDPSLQQRLGQAVERLTDLSHPNLAQVIGLEELDGALCIVTEHVEGISLRDLLSQSGLLDLDSVRQIGGDVAAALQALSQHGVTGVDVRPDNVMIQPDGQAVLTDVGLIYTLRALAGRDRTHLFPAPYVAPEVARGERPTIASATYALAIMLYELLSGVPPFVGADSAVIFQHLNQEPPKLSQASRRRFGPAVDAVIMPALAKMPKDRMPLDQFAASLDRLQPPTSRFNVVPEMRQGIGVAMLLLAMALLGWQIWQRVGAGNASAVVASPSGSGLIGRYEITVPAQIRRGQTRPIRLAIHIADDLSAADLPSMPAQPPAQVVSEGLFGSVDLCAKMWAQLDLSGLEVAGPATVSRLVHAPGTEWRWDVCCQADTQLEGPQSAVIRIFVRPTPDTEMVLKEIHFDLQVASGLLLSDINLALVMAVLVVSGMIILFTSRKGIGDL